MIRVIGFKDIYSAWESQVVSFIEDYMEDANSSFRGNFSQADDKGEA